MSEAYYRERLSYEQLLLQLLLRVAKARAKVMWGEVGATLRSMVAYINEVAALIDMLTPSLRREVAERLGFNLEEVFKYYLVRPDRSMAQEVVLINGEWYEQVRKKREKGQSVTEEFLLRAMWDSWNAYLTLLGSVVRTVVEVLEAHGLLLRERELLKGVIEVGEGG